MGEHAMYVVIVSWTLYGYVQDRMFIGCKLLCSGTVLTLSLCNETVCMPLEVLTYVALELCCVVY